MNWSHTFDSVQKIKNNKLNQELRQIAKANNEIYYYPITSCKHNHENKKFVANNHCVQCTEINKEKYRNTEKGKLKDLCYSRNYQKINKHIIRAKVYSLSPEDIEWMKISQNNLCKICEKPFKDDFKHMNVDHCHNTTKVRGLLCRACNIGIGCFKDSPKLLRKAALYCE